MKIQYSMVFVSDMGEATAFYRDVVGIPLRFESPGWTEFATEGATLALHATDNPAPDDPKILEAAGACRLGFSVEDLDAFHARMMDRRVECLQEPATQFGARLAQYSGPDGLVFTVGESKGS